MKINSQNVQEFFFFSDSLDSILKKYIMAIVLPLGIKNANELFKAYASLTQGVSGPIGENWDAMNDALRGFDLLDNRLKEIVIFHQDIPMIDDAGAVKSYLDCLIFCQDFWKKTKDENKEPIRELKIIFPIKAKDKIIEIMDGYKMME